MDAETALPTPTCSTRKSSNSRPFAFRRPCNGVARTPNPAWLSALAVRNGGACGAAIRGARVLKHVSAPRSSSKHFGSPASTAIRSRPMGHERQTRHDSGQRPKPITIHRRPRHALRQGARILAPVVSAIWVVEESFGMTLPGGATDSDSRPLLALLVLACWAPRALARTHQGTMLEGTLA